MRTLALFAALLCGCATANQRVAMTLTTGAHVRTYRVALDDHACRTIDDASNRVELCSVRQPGRTDAVVVAWQAREGEVLRLVRSTVVPARGVMHELYVGPSTLRLAFE